MEALKLPIKCSCVSETIELAHKLALRLNPGDVVCLRGDLGAGKTTFAKGLIEKLAENIHRDEITSPTFVTMNLYNDIAHFDLYRLESIDSFLGCGFDEYLEPPYTAIIEWPELIESLLPAHVINIELERVGEDVRIIKLNEASLREQFYETT